MRVKVSRQVLLFWLKIVPVRQLSCHSCGIPRYLPGQEVNICYYSFLDSSNEQKVLRREWVTNTQVSDISFMICRYFCAFVVAQAPTNDQTFCSLRKLNPTENNKPFTEYPLPLPVPSSGTLPQEMVQQLYCCRLRGRIQCRQRSDRWIRELPESSRYQDLPL